MTVEVISAPPGCCSDVLFNGNHLQNISNANDRVSGVVLYIDPKIALPELVSLEWGYIDSLPESNLLMTTISGHRAIALHPTTLAI
ncbi:hypothetical protein BDV38DRAFT_259946 [Aspergillus pseudotamarii]|uniref:Uncharacterized protein n=1 Tax=Aspergillus pseudotamarii TaxID=132259 RepID=A0A5N6SE90_ASPPS|nr:uncharacterized protein BDV38DRAFT_259946 [Aspergillus pseudotamarii]KAE8132935.1 hypothetical protein BDV38DRAFT_259946 [Aspergillus pseudotamarii]